ncbi:MAG: hypothetical protein GXY44_04380 [Phycisphaerales bacterium]|nr:hypothetical protein [Phycisphaerales bacterium]
MKIARAMKNMSFSYTITPVEIAESMAFNLDCLGCVCWFEYGRIMAMPGTTIPFSDTVKPYISFFHKRRDLIRDTDVVADVAILRNFPSQAFANPEHAALTYRVEQIMIEERVPFQIIFDRQLADLSRYRSLVLAGCVALSDRHIEEIKNFVSAGGRLCVVGPAAEYDEWLRPRAADPLAAIAPDRVVRVDAQGDIISAVRRSCADRLAIAISAPVGLGIELTEQTQRRLVHLVNYRPDGPIREADVELRVPAGKRIKSVTMATPQAPEDTDLAFAQQADLVTFRIPGVEIYAIAVVSWE